MNGSQARGRLWPLGLATCISIIALGIVIPVLPFQLRALGASEAMTPLIFTTYSAMAFITAPFWGRLSDRIGRRPVLILAISASVLSYAWLGLADSVWQVFAARAFSGATAGWLATSQAYVADVTGKEARAKGMAMLGIAFGVGFTIGPFTGAMLVGHGGDFHIPAFIAAGMAALSFLVTIALIREPARHIADAEAPRLRLEVLREPLLARLLLLYFAFAFVFTGMEGVFAIWVERILSLGAREVGMYLGFTGVVTVLVQGGIGRLSARLGEVRLMVIGAFALAAGLLSLSLIDRAELVYIPMALVAIGAGLHNPAAQSLISRSAPDHLRGGVMGSAQALASLARIAGPALAGFAFAGVAPNAPLWIGAALLIPVLLLAFAQRRRVAELIAAGR